jgi:FkbM family methyltransferase
MIREFIKKNTPKAILNQMYWIYKIIVFRKTPVKCSPDRSTSSLACITAYNKFGGYCLPLNSIQRPALQATLRGMVWEEETLSFLRANCNGGDVVHAGTYFGDFLPGLSDACDPDNFIWAFEPNYENFRCASITCLINNLDNIKLHNSGLGEIEETGIMKTIDLNGTSMGGSSTILKNENIPSNNTEEIKITSLDAIIPKDRHISLLQLDVEGYEKEALSGSLKLIERCLPILVIETLPDQNWVEKNLFSLGYKVINVIQGNSILVK